MPPNLNSLELRADRIQWYRRHEAQKRYSFFFSSTTLAGAFGGLLAAAIGKMDGLQGYAGWRWVMLRFKIIEAQALTWRQIFILEGALTVAVAFLFFFILPDFPEESKWLRDDEKAYVAARLRADQGQSARERKITLRDVGRVFKDFKVFCGGFMYFGLIVRVNFTSLFWYMLISANFNTGPCIWLCLLRSRHYFRVWLRSHRDPVARGTAMGCGICVRYGHVSHQSCH